MVTRLLTSTLKILFFFIVMCVVDRLVPYHDLVKAFINNHIGFYNAQAIAKFILDEPDPEPYESIYCYICFFINALISVPLFSLLLSLPKIIFFKGVWTKARDNILRETMRRFKKLFSFIFLFWLLLKIFPYELLFPTDGNYSSIILSVVAGFHLILTIACYWFFICLINKYFVK